MSRMDVSSSRRQHGEEEEVEGEVIPWHFVPPKVKQELIKRLNPTLALSGNDWRMLADELGCSPSDINFIESEKDTNTHLLFAWYGIQPGASFNDVYRFLVKMQRKDCVDILDAANAEIRQTYRQAQRSLRSQTTNPSRLSPTGGQNPMQQNHFCSSPQAVQWTSSNGSHIPCLYDHGQSGNCTSPSCDRRPVVSCTSPSCSHEQTSCTRSSCVHGLTGSCTNPGFAVCCASFSCDHKPVVSCTSPLCDHGPCGSCTSCPGNQRHARGNHSSPTHDSRHKSRSFAKCLSGCQQTALRCGVNCHQDLTGRSQPVNWQDAPQTACNSPPNHTSPKHINTPRKPLANSSPSSYSHEDRSSGNIFPSQISSICSQQINLYVNRKESQTYTSSGAVSGGEPLINVSTDPSMHMTVSRLKMSRQLSGGNHVTPDCHRDKRLKDRNSGRTFGTDHQFPSHSVAIHDGSRVHMPPALSVKCFSEPTVVNHCKDSERPSNCSHSPSTVPLTRKAAQERGAGGLTCLAISQQSLSLPADTKPQEFGKAFSDRKVFVTYSYDSETHVRQVLSLCKFLQDNDCACLVDVSERNPGRYFKMFEWCREKITGADVILVCISNKYLEDITYGQPHHPSSTEERRLHTKEIYEFLNSRHPRCSGMPRPYVVPLLFPGMTLEHIPQQMRGGLAYTWPQQYLDLARQLRKLQARVRVSQKENGRMERS